MQKVGDARFFWDGILEAVQHNGFNRSNFDCWVKPSRLLGVDGSTAVIACPTQEHCDWLNEHAKAALIKAVADSGNGQLTHLRFLVL